MGRSADIFGRVKRNLAKYGITVAPTKVLAEEIYDALSAAQDNIIADHKIVERHITLTTVIAQEGYLLSDLVDSNGDEVLIALLKAVLRPATWDYPVEIVSIRDWDEIKNSQRNSYYPSASATANQPLYICLSEEKILMYPAPTAAEDITLVAILGASPTKISTTIEPIIPRYWDKALEYSVTADFLSEDLAVYYENLAQKERSNKKSIAHINHNGPRVQKLGW